MAGQNLDVLNGLVAVMAMFDDGTSQHLVATATFAKRVAETLRLDEDTIERCRIGALLHDVGLLNVDRSIIKYAGMPADIEWEELTAHPVHGAQLLAGIPSLAHIAPIVRAHHERIDGYGYPDALIGHEIPVEARIIAVVDAFHTMTMPHDYRNNFTTTSALDELTGNSGSQFDPDVVAAFQTTIGARNHRLRFA